ncbi:MAG: 1-deoxy-D-xylulose-5-phosphate synthase [Prevotella sp.]|nr:1-deoxy-D-xylulose-5-phosphate synthase [Prevotella sp.]MCM1075116.1 1-deoxy-D-xylulose-5-phosphate synthase [Ruminococcus sp.]
MTDMKEEGKALNKRIPLEGINLPEDLRNFEVDKLPQVCEDLRDLIIKTLSSNPGHFASSMGTVELTVALHYVFNTPKDRIVWDVGHQSYAHKLLTGRKDRFDTLRKQGGLSGFPNPKESEYDTFTAGHASNSISAALGMAIADRLTPENHDRKTVAVIGDASISGGLAFEGLNNASNNDNNLLIILNDNDMSIDNNVGALHRYLSKMSTSAGYNRMRYRAYKFMKRHRIINERGRKRIIRFTNSVKSLISHRQNIFEGLNIRYFGPIDGHNIQNLVKVLNEIKDMEGPRLLHICTVKGKGYAPAEKNPTTWHAPGKFNPETGERNKPVSGPHPLKWQEVFGNTLVELAETHPQVVGITAAMLSGTSMNLMMEKFPERTFDVGISEGHAVTFAGGLAAAGKHPFVAIYSSFLQRAYDNIIHDVCIQGLPVTFCIDRAGVVGDDGVTHHGLFDMAYLSVIPGLSIASPMDEATLRNLMYSSLSYASPTAIRYPRGEAVSVNWQSPMQQIENGRGRCLSKPCPGSVAILSIGPVGNDVQQAVELLSKEGIAVAHYDMIWLKPLDINLLQSAVKAGVKAFITVEDASVRGGLGSAVSEWLKQNYPDLPIIKLGVSDHKWVHHGTVSQLRSECNYDVRAIVDAVKNLSSNTINNPVQNS